MGVQKPKEMKRIKMQKLNKQILQQLITDVMMWPTSKAHDVISTSEETQEISLIELAVVRCSYIGAYEGDTKRLEWLLSKMGIREDVEQDTNQSLSKLDSDTVLKALNIKGDTGGESKKKRGRQRKNGEG